MKINAVTLLVFSLCSSALCRNLNVVPLWNGERLDNLNLWAGTISSGTMDDVIKQNTVVHSGRGAYRVELGTIPKGEMKFFQLFTTNPKRGLAYRQDRNLTRYRAMEGYVRNDSPEALTLTLELKDYRDSGDDVAKYSIEIPGSSPWTKFSAPLDLKNGWVVTGNPDLTRAFALSFLVSPRARELKGNLYFDDVVLIEKGDDIDVATAPLRAIVEKLAERQFDALWTARNKMSALIPNTAGDVTVGAANTTTGVVRNLPSAVKRGWVTQKAADEYVAHLVKTLNRNRDQTKYLITRFYDLPTGNATGDREESTIDGSFLTLALYHYQAQPTTPVKLRKAILKLLDRFNFQAFVRDNGFDMAYFGTGEFSGGSYNCYTTEPKVIALAATLSGRQKMPLKKMWHKDTRRELDHLVDPANEHLVCPNAYWRAPFVQALLNLFVDTSDRGVDNYPDPKLARNPWENFVRYEAEVSAKLASLGRPYLFQPDNGFWDSEYYNFNLYVNHKPQVFQPWSTALALLAGADRSEEALRFLLNSERVDGPLGLADATEWPSGSQEPSRVTSYVDNWNMTLSTLSFMEWLDGEEKGSRFFAKIPKVKAELDTVFIGKRRD